MTNTITDHVSKRLLKEMSSESPQLSKIQEYLEEGADVNYQSEDDGFTALMRASEAENYQLVDYLLQSGANPLLLKNNQKASDLTLPHAPAYQLLKNYELLFATHNNDINTVKELLKSGIDINFQGPGGYTALLIAVEQSVIELVDFFLSNGADMSLERNDGAGVFVLVKDYVIYKTLCIGEALSDETKEKIRAEEKIDHRKIYKKAQLKTIEDRQNKPFHVSQLKMSHCKPPPNETQLSEIEQHFGHPLPEHLKELYLNYNGGWPGLDIFGEYDERQVISHFYKLGDDHEDISNIWQVIDNLGDILGPDALPFAEHDYGATFFLKWEENQAKVYILYCGELALEYFDSQGESWDSQSLPVAIEPVTDSLDEFLEGLYATE